jgi:hypothetical protein
MRGHRASAATHRAGKSGASRRVSAKIALWGVEVLDRITRYALRTSPAIWRSSLETRLMRIIETGSLAQKADGFLLRSAARSFAVADVIVA